MKLMSRVQVAPAVSEKLLVQLPDGTKEFEPILRPGDTAFSGSLPMFCTETDCGLSVLVLPSTVAAKVKAGGCER
jgi:hypothetical protein